MADIEPQAQDEQDIAEAFDSDKLDDDVDDPAGELMYPPDRPLGVNQYGTTVAEERVTEPTEERMRRETRDPLDAIAEPNEEELRQIELDEADTDVGLDDLGDAIAAADDTALDDLDGSGSVGRLVDPSALDDGVDAVDDEADAVAMRADENERDLSAEEDAVHLTSDPPFHPLGDGYVDDDEDDASG